MAIITLPTGLRIASCTIGQVRYDMMETSDATGHQAARLFGPARWRMSITSHPAMTQADAVIWESLVLRLRGGINHLAIGDPVRKVPRGTMRGTLTLSAQAAAGETTLSITGGAGQASKTLLAGDWLQVGTGLSAQLFKVVTDATANGSGVISVTVEPPVRATFASSTAVAWSSPIAHFKAVGAPQWSYAEAQTQGSFALDLLESWT
jgi:hypothetical protein